MTDYQVYKDDETGLYVAEHPELPVSSCGDTVEEAVQNAKDAVQMYEEPEGESTPDYDLDRVTDVDDVEEMVGDLEIIKDDTIEADEDIDVLHNDVNLRMERLSEDSLYIAGYSGGDEDNIDTRYWLTVTENGGLRIDREIVQNYD